MSLGDNILKLRKKKGISQEQLGEEINVTRQTISNWELGETSPNPEQLKILSKSLNVSIDELLDNDIKAVLEEKVSNTEKLAGMIIKILKGIGIALIVFIIIDIVAFIVFTASGRSYNATVAEEFEITCSTKEKDYLISVGTDGYFNCSNCSKEIQKELKKNYIDYSDLRKTETNIKNYFKNNGGSCE